MPIVACVQGLFFNCGHDVIEQELEATQSLIALHGAWKLLPGIIIKED
jgi:hypothetical protein